MITLTDTSGGVKRLFNVMDELISLIDIVRLSGEVTVTDMHVWAHFKEDNVMQVFNVPSS